MSIRLLFLLYSLGLGVYLLVSTAQTSPGYMDAEYYLAGGLQLLSGQGLIEPYIWNYLADPSGLPAPSHAYWMPLASLLSAIGMSLANSESFTAASFPFILLAAATPPLTAALSYSLHHRRDLALLAGILATIPGFYLPFLTTTATFAPYMFLGAIYFLLVARLLKPIVVTRSNMSPDEISIISSSTLPKSATAKNVTTKTAIALMFDQSENIILIFLGIVTGLMYLTRSDGLLYVLIGLIVANILASKSKQFLLLNSFITKFYPTPINPKITANLSLSTSRLELFLHFLYTSHFLLGFLVVSVPWFLRNRFTFGTFLPPSSARTLWLTNYDQLFSYPASILTFESWWASGIGNILQSRLWSLGQNLQTTLAVQGMIFLFPLIMFAAWRMRRDPMVRLGVLAFFITLIAMTFIFPFAGARGGFFHSGAALQPLLWALAPIGLASFVSWGELHRGWNAEKSLPVFSVFMVGFALLLTNITTLPRLLPTDGQIAPWNQGQSLYLQLETALVASGAFPGDVVMVNNPPGYYLASQRPALVIPNGDLAPTLAVAKHFRASYLLLDQNHPWGLKYIYQNPSSHPGLEYITTIGNTHIFRFVE